MPIVIPEEEKQSLGLPTAAQSSDTGPSMPIPPSQQGGSISGSQPSFWQKNGSKLMGLAGTALSAAFGGRGAGAGFASGYANQAIKIQDENRKRQTEAEDFNIRKAHESMAQLKTLRIPDLRGKVPDLVLENVMKLVREYNEALMETSPGKGTLTPAEAAKIMQHYGLLQGDIASAYNAQRDIDEQAQFTNKATAQRESEIGGISLGMADANKPEGFMGPPPEGAPMGSIEKNAQSPGVRNQAISEWARRHQPVNINIGGQDVPVAPEHLAPYAAMYGRQAHWTQEEASKAADRKIRLYLGTLHADVAQRIAQSGRMAQLTQSLTQLYMNEGPKTFDQGADAILAMAGGPPNVGNPIVKTPAPRSPADWNVGPPQ